MDVYDPQTYRKHKWPEGWGSLCPHDLGLDDAQSLLATGVRIGDEIYNVSGDWAFRAQQHEPGRWHGHPIPWSRLPAEARARLIEAGRLDDKRYRKAVRKNLGSEFA